MGTQNIRLDLKRTWDGTSLGLVHPADSKKRRSSGLEKQYYVRYDGTKQQLRVGHNLGARNSSLDLNMTWDGTSLGLVQGLALQKRAEPPAWRSNIMSVRMAQNISLNLDTTWAP
jgi:hypothetical protein